MISVVSAVIVCEREKTASSAIFFLAAAATATAMAKTLEARHQWACETCCKSSFWLSKDDFHPLPSDSTFSAQTSGDAVPSRVKPYVPLHQSRNRERPGPVVTEDGLPTKVTTLGLAGHCSCW